jgi:hypothetical protein
MQAPICSDMPLPGGSVGAKEGCWLPLFYVNVDAAALMTLYLSAERTPAASGLSAAYKAQTDVLVGACGVAS